MGQESIVEKHLRERAKENDYLCYKFTSPGNNGVPDRILIGHGQTIFIETKAPKKVPRKLQERVIGRMREHGANVLVIDTKEKVDELFDKILSKD